MKKLAALAVLALAFSAQAKDIAATFDSGEVTSVAITSTAINTQRADSCKLYVDNTDGDGTRALDVYCLDPDGVTTVYQYDTVTVGTGTYARVLFDASSATTGTNTTRFQQGPCIGRTRITLAALTGKKATVFFACHR